MDSLYMAATKIPSHTSIADVMRQLRKAGAIEITQTFGFGGTVNGLRFSIIVRNIVESYQLPVRTEPILSYLQDEYKRASSVAENLERDIERAERIAWRIISKWLEAQLTLIALGMVETGEVFIPYMLDAAGKSTMWQTFAAGRYKALPPGKP